MALIIIILILAILLVVFTLQNTIDITLNIFFWKIEEAPLVLVLMCCVVLGYLLATIYFYPKLWMIRNKVKHVQEQNRKLKESTPSGRESETREWDKDNPEGIILDDDDFI